MEEEAEGLVIEAEAFEGEEGLVGAVVGLVGTALGLVETGAGSVETGVGMGAIEVVMGVIEVAEVGSAVATRAVASEAAFVVAETNSLGEDLGNDNSSRIFFPYIILFFLQRTRRRHWIPW